MSQESNAARVLAAALFSLVVVVLLAPVGGLLRQGLASSPAYPLPVADPASDSVAATAAEFRVDETGAATYSIPIYGVPGTAGVQPKLALSYSSQGGYGPIGKGWSITGLSSISRCRATREAGDFIANGAPVDGSPRPVNYTDSDRYCLDGQRLIPAPAGSAECRAVGGFTAINLRTEVESFQRICGYAGANGVAFFTVERKDGSLSWYGDRVSYTAQDLGYGGYVNSTVPGKEGYALAWAQTRFQDSTGNYIDFLYHVSPNGATGEHLLREVRYTGKLPLAGQSVSVAPYARIIFNYGIRNATAQSKGFQGGGLVTQAHRLESIVSCDSYCSDDKVARFYQLSYAPSPSGSGLEALISVQECRDSTKAICLPPTTFTWSSGRYEFATKEYPPNLPTGSLSKFEGFKLGDIDGDGRQDIVYLKDSDSCGTEELYVLYGITTANGGVSFTQSAPICTPSELHWYGEGSWHLFDYTGDGRDDLFVRGGSSWMVFPSQGRNGNANFVTSQNLIAGLSPAIPAQNGTGDQVQIADLNGDGLTDIVYPSGGILRARLMERQSGGYGWGTERTVVFDGVDTTGWQINDPNCQSSEYSCWFEMAGVPSSKTGFSHLADFNGDAASDLVIGVVQHVQYEGWCEPPPCPGCEPQSLPVRVSRGLSDGPRTAAYGTEAEVAALNRCQGSRVVRQTHAMSVSEVSPTQITVSSVAFISGHPHAISIADANGDGLSDFFYRGTADADWQYRINTGAGMQPPVVLDLLDFEDQTRFVDVNGDGRADVLHPANMGPYKTYNVRYALPSGGYGPEQWLPGGNNTNANATLCEGYACDHTRKVPIFADFDADGNIDFVSIKMDDNADLLVSRSSSRFAPRDVIVRFTNGLGAETDVYYAPLTNAAVYRRDSGTRNAVNWGRGSAVLDLLAPTYVVARAASSSPNAADITAKAVLHYRYAGAKIQAGGRGFLAPSRLVWNGPPDDVSLGGCKNNSSPRLWG